MTTTWPGSFSGRPGSSSWSFANAMFEPQNEIEPMIAASSDGISALREKNPP